MRQLAFIAWTVLLSQCDGGIDNAGTDALADHGVPEIYCDEVEGIVSGYDAGNLVLACAANEICAVRGTAYVCCVPSSDCHCGLTATSSPCS